jgi:hypothetical protein
VAALPANNVSLTDRICESVHPNGSPGCSDGAGLLAGALVLAAVAGVAALDIVKRRRRHLA